MNQLKQRMTGMIFMASLLLTSVAHAALKENTNTTPGPEGLGVISGLVKTVAIGVRTVNFVGNTIVVQATSDDSQFNKDITGELDDSFRAVDQAATAVGKGVKAIKEDPTGVGAKVAGAVGNQLKKSFVDGDPKALSETYNVITQAIGIGGAAKEVGLAAKAGAGGAGKILKVVEKASKANATRQRVEAAVAASKQARQSSHFQRIATTERVTNAVKASQAAKPTTGFTKFVQAEKIRGAVRESAKARPNKANFELLTRQERLIRGETEIVQRAVTGAELKFLQGTGLLRFGKGKGKTFVSDAVNTRLNRARLRSAIPESKDFRIKVEVPKGVFSRPTKVEPFDSGKLRGLPSGKETLPGGGSERFGLGKVPAKIKKIDEF